MTTINQNHQFEFEIIKAMHFDSCAFREALLLHRPYEIMIHKWICKMHTKNKTTKEAIDLIYKALRFYYLQRMKQTL